MTRFKPAKKNKPTKKDSRRDAEQLLLLAMKSQEHFEVALKIVATEIGTPRGCMTKIKIEKADDVIEGDKLARFTIFVQDEKVWEGWFERYLEKEQIKTNDNRVQEQVSTYATWKDAWYPMPELTPLSEEDNKLNELYQSIETEDLNKGI